MSDAPKKRPWFQYHLSTVVVLMFVAGGIMALNWFRQADEYGVEGPGLDPLIVKSPGYGWPFRFTDFSVVYMIQRAPNSGGIVDIPIVTRRISYSWLAADIAVALAILLGTAMALEWPIRRRERRP